MIRLALRLTLAGGREALARLAVIAAAVAIGVGLLLASLAGMNAVNAQNDRYAWLNAGAVPAADPGADPMWWSLRADYYDRRMIHRVDVAATGPASPVPPGLPRLPGPGEFYASPALGELLAGTPAGQLADRFPGRLAGTIGPAALPAPDSLIVVVGRTPGELSTLPGAVRAGGIPDTLPANCADCVIGIPAAGMHLVLAVVAGAMLFPVLMFIGTATRLSATRREQRFAALRLIGATPRQVSVLAAVEATASAVVGTAAGFVLFLLLRDRLAAIPFTGNPFFPADLSLGPAVVLAVGLGVPAAAAVAARSALRRVHISPLGVTRRVTPRPPRAYRLIPLLLGIAELLWFVGRRPSTSMGQIQAFLPGFLIIMVGLVIAGPWLTMVGARLLARCANRPATLIAARRLADNPRAAFRSVSGLILALFVTSVAVGVIGTIVTYRGAPTDGGRAGNLSTYFLDPAPPSTAAPAGLASIPGVTGVAAVRQAPDGVHPPEPAPGESVPQNLALCSEIAQTPDFGRCPAGAEVAWVWPDFVEFDAPPGTSTVWPAAAVPAASLAALPVQSIVVGTDGSTPAIEPARTLLAEAFPQRRPPGTAAEFDAEAARVFLGWKRLADVVVVMSLAIAGCSLAAAAAAGLADRKRPFAMMRLAGAPLRVLRWVVALESTVPLLTAAAVAIGTGLVAAHLFLTAQMEYALSPPGPSYYAVVAAGLVASLGVIASTLPLLRRITGPETARNE